MSHRDWIVGDYGLAYDEANLPPDITGEQGDCPAIYELFLCTRPTGHTGRHAAGDGRFIVAVWAS